MIVDKVHPKKLKRCYLCSWTVHHSGGACRLCGKENKLTYMHTKHAVYHFLYGYVCIKHAFQLCETEPKSNSTSFFTAAQPSLRVVYVHFESNDEFVVWYSKGCDVFYCRGTTLKSELHSKYVSFDAPQCVTKEECDALQRYFLYERRVTVKGLDIFYISRVKTLSVYFEREIYCDKQGNQLGIHVQRKLLFMLRSSSKRALQKFCEYTISEEFKQKYFKAYYQNSGKKRMASIGKTVKSQIMQFKKNPQKNVKISTKMYCLEDSDFTWEIFKSNFPEAWEAWQELIWFVTASHAVHGFCCPSVVYETLDFLHAFGQSLNLHYDFGMRFKHNRGYSPFIGMPQWQIDGRKFVNVEDVDWHGNFSKLGCIELFTGDIVFLYDKSCWWFCHGIVLSKDSFYQCSQFRGT